MDRGVHRSAVGGVDVPKFTVKAVQASLESDKSMSSFESAMRHVTGPGLEESVNVAWNQVMLDAWIQSSLTDERAPISIHSRWAHFGVRTVTTLRFELPGGQSRAMEWEGDPGWIALDPSWTESAWLFVKLGITHILTGADHLLFLLCLDRKSTRLNSSHIPLSRMPSSA